MLCFCLCFAFAGETQKRACKQTCSEIDANTFTARVPRMMPNAPYRTPECHTLMGLHTLQQKRHCALRHRLSTARSWLHINAHRSDIKLEFGIDIANSQSIHDTSSSMRKPHCKLFEICQCDKTSLSGCLQGWVETNRLSLGLAAARSDPPHTSEWFQNLFKGLRSVGPLACRPIDRP